MLIHTYAHVYREYLSTKGSLTEYIADSDRPLKFTNAHLDPFEPDRVWLTFYPKSTGNGYEGAPEVIGVSINVDGLCYKVTAGYITDRTKSAGGALVGGNYGYKNTSPLGTTSINGFSLAVAEAFVPKSAPVASANKPKPVVASQPRSQPIAKPVALTTTSSSSSSSSTAMATKKPTSKPSPPLKAAPVVAKKPTVAVAKPAIKLPIKKLSPSSSSSSPAPKAKPSPTPQVSEKKAVVKPSSPSLPKFSFGIPNDAFKTKPSSPAQSSSSSQPSEKGAMAKIDPKKAAQQKAEQTKKEAEEKKLAATEKAKLELQQKKDAERKAKQEKELKLATEKKAKEDEIKKKKSGTTKQMAPTPVSSSSSSSSSLPKNLVSIITKSKGNVSKVEEAIMQFNDGKIQNEQFCKAVIGAMGSTDAAVGVLPDIIGALPRGDRKSKLNQYYQQQL